jgi:hypothetical protein
MILQANRFQRLAKDLERWLTKPDYVLYNAATAKTVIWYLNNNVFVSAALGPTLPAGWSLVGQ